MTNETKIQLKFSAEPFRTILAFAVCVLIAAIVEVGVFNYDWISSFTSGEPITISPTDENCVESASKGTLTIYNVDTVVKNMRIQFKSGDQNVEVSAMDESMSWYRIIGTIKHSGEPLYFHQEGKTLSIGLDTAGTPSNAIESITLNGVTLIDFSFARFGLIALLLFAFWLVRPKSAWWNKRLLDHKKIIPICVCVMCCIALATLCLNYGTRDYDINDYRNLFQYNDLARALSQGHVYLDFEPGEALLALDNPYDVVAREGIDCMWDFALYNGKYYSYFGVIPCVVFYLPYYLITGNALPNLVVVMIALVAFYAGGAYLLRRVIGRWFPQASIASFVMCCVVLLFGTISLSLVCLPTIYPVPIACGAACAIWALGLWLRACEGKKFSWGHALAGTLLGALTLGCRPQFFLVFLFILALFIDTVRKKRVKATAFFPLIIPIVVVAALLGAYNYARFGSPLDFGSSYNLTNDDMSAHSVTLYMGALGIFGFLLQPPQIVADWPFVFNTCLSWKQNSDLVLEETLGGIFAVAPLTLAAFWFFWNKRLRQERVLLVFSIIGVVCAFLLAVFDACAGGYIMRYQVDMGFFIAITASIGILVATSKLLPTRSEGLSDSASSDSIGNNGLVYAVKFGFFVLTCISIALSSLYFMGVVA